MTTHLVRNIGRGLRLVAFAVAVVPAADWIRAKSRLPAGYGAAGDRRFANPIPALLRHSVDELTRGTDGSWVKERVENGSWVYELHVSKHGKSSVVRLSSNGHVLRTPSRPPAPRTSEAGEELARRVADSDSAEPTGVRPTESESGLTP